MLKRRQDYQPPAFLVTSVYISIDIKDDFTYVTTKLELRRNQNVAPGTALWLDGQDIELTRLIIDSVDLPLGDDMPDHLSLCDQGLSVAGLGDQAVIEVWDQGEGMPADQWDRALQPFQRLDESRGQQGHCGLGLAIVAHVARIHGGDLSCGFSDHDAPGRFVIRLCLPLNLCKPGV